MTGAKAKLIALGGLTGVGKTTLAYALQRDVVELREALIFDEDQVRRELRGHDLRITMTDADYAPEVTVKVRAHMDQLTRDALEKGITVIDSSGFWREAGRAHVAALAASCGVTFVGFWLYAPLDILEARIQRRLDERANLPVLSQARGHASDACPLVLQKQTNTTLPLAGEGWNLIKSDGSENTTLRAVWDILFPNFPGYDALY